MLSEGIYKAKATSWGWTETSNGHPKFWMSFDVIAPAGGHDEGAKGTWSITPTTEAAQEWLARTVKHLGYEGDDLLMLDPDEEGAHDFTGIEFDAELKHKEYKEQMREDWTVVTASKPKLGRDKLVELSGRMADKFKAKAERAKPKAATEPADVPY